MKKKLYYIYLVILTALVAGCQDDAMFTTEDMEEEMAYVTYQLKMGDGMQSRAIGDGVQVDELKVGVFQGQQLLKIFTYKKADTENFKKVTIPLLKQETYDLVFWAQKEGNGIYTIDETNFNITVNYDKYTDISLKGTEAFEAFTLKQTDVKVGTTQTSITLTRPFAQLNVAASEEDVFQNVNKVSFTISKVYTVFNPYTGETSGEKADQVFSYSFSEEDISTKQSISIGDANYYYLASAYMFAPDKVTMQGGLYKDTALVKELNVAELPLNANTRTNIYGDMIQQEELQGWNGWTFTEPTDEGLECELNAEDMGLENVQVSEILHIDTPEELAWCMKNGYPEGIKVIHICSNLNMGSWDWSDLPTEEGSARSSQSIIPKNLPAGMMIVGDSPEGTLPYTISNITVSSTGLFGNVESLTVKNIAFKNVNVSVQSSDAGVLVGTLTGNSSFQNVTLEECSVNTSGYAGGMVGHISRKSETDRGETLSVFFNGCQVYNTYLQGGTTGKFVGLFNGYDNKESLSFDALCSSDETTDNDYSPYREGNESVWLSSTNYKDYNAWLGNEKYYRGNVTFGGTRFIPKWDGTTTVEPLLANTTYDSEVTAAANRYVVYSAFDLAGVRKKTASPAAIYLRADIDMNGQGDDDEYAIPSNFESANDSNDDNNFTPFSSVAFLDGDGNTIYNLGVNMVHDGTGAAFIQSVSGTTTHQNINFEGACIRNVHKSSIPLPAYGVTNDGGAGNAYAGTIVSHTGGDYTISNVHVKNGGVYAVCKMGGLVGYVGGNLTMTNCSVDDYTIENYAPGVPNYYTLPRQYELNLSSIQKLSGITSLFQVGKIPSVALVNCLQWWYTNGECGGLIGFIKSPSSTIDKCSVTNSSINCVGQPNKAVVANVWDKEDFDSNNPYVSGKKIFAKGNTDIAGRHVNQFIGDIVSERKEGGTNYNITISDYEVSGNTYFDNDASTATEYSHNYESGKYCEIVGCAYYIGVDVKMFGIDLTHVNDCAGSLTFYPLNGTSLTLTEEVKSGDKMSWTGGSFTDVEYKQKQEGFLFWVTWSYNVDSEYPTYP